MWFAIISGSGVFARRTSAKILISWRNSLHRITCRQLRIEFEVRCTCEASSLENNSLHHGTIESSFTMLSFCPDFQSSNILALFVNKREYASRTEKNALFLMTLNHALRHEFYTQRKKKKSLNSQLASDPWRFPALLLVETFNGLLHDICRVFSAGWSVNLSCFSSRFDSTETGEIFKLYFAAEISTVQRKKCSSRHKLYTRKHAILNNKIFAHLACYACILL